jgi:hypothetical protein
MAERFTEMVTLQYGPYSAQLSGLISNHIGTCQFIQSAQRHVFIGIIFRMHKI